MSDIRNPEDSNGMAVAPSCGTPDGKAGNSVNPPELHELAEQKEDLVKRGRELGEDFSRVLGDNLYKDAQHFIYELLQNAEDAGATRVEFHLYEDEQMLVMRHNGDKLFDIDDVKKVVGIGYSDKQKETSIGRFGLGFKSIYGITKEPEVHSGRHHFRIEEYRIPMAIDCDKCCIDTVFRFPLIVDADSIWKFLGKIDRHCLIFLSNIEAIECRCDEEAIQYGRQTIKADSMHGLSVCDVQLEYRKLQGEDESVESAKYVLMGRDSDTVKGRKVQIAYAKDNDGDVISASMRHLYVFFATMHETGMGFLLQAPYITTATREQIPFGKDINILLSEELGVLVADSLSVLKEKGLLDHNSAHTVFKLLPLTNEHGQDQLGSVVQGKLKEAFATNQLVPVQDGKFARAGKCLLIISHTLRAIYDCLADEERGELFGCGMSVAGEISEEMAQVLGIKVAGIKDTVENVPPEYFKDKTEQHGQDWLIGLYRAINNNNRVALVELGQACIMPLQDGRWISPLSDTKPWLPRPSDAASDSNIEYENIPVVALWLAKDGDARQMLAELGLKEVDELAEIKAEILPKYQQNIIQVSKEEYIKDIGRVAEIYGGYGNKKAIIEALCNANIALTREGEYCMPKEVYWHSQDIEAWPISAVKFLIDMGNHDATIKSFMIDLGMRTGILLLEDRGLEEFVRDKKSICGKELFYKLSGNFVSRGTDGIDVRIIEGKFGNWHSQGWYSFSNKNFNPCFDISNLDIVLNRINLRCSLVLWSILANKHQRLDSILRIEGGESRLKSKALQAVEGRNWLYGVDGKLLMGPMKGLNIHDLHEGYLRGPGAERLARILGISTDAPVVPREKYDQLMEENARLKGKIEELEERIARHAAGHGSSDTAGINGADDEANSDPEHESNGRVGIPIGPGGAGPNETGTNAERIALNILSDMYGNDNVKWLNRHHEQYEPYDFVVSLGYHGDMLYIEVKGTKHKPPYDFNISMEQWECAKKKGDSYVLLVIFNVGDDSVSKNPTAWIRDPYKQWGNKDLDVRCILFRVDCDIEEDE